MTFNEANTAEAFVRDRLAGSGGSGTVKPALARQGGWISGLGWHFVEPAALPRRSQEAFVEELVRDASLHSEGANPTRCSLHMPKGGDL